MLYFCMAYLLNFLLFNTVNLMSMALDINVFKTNWLVDDIACFY